MLPLRWVVAAWLSWQAAQTVQPNPDQPLFRSGVDLVEVQATVLDSSGQPVRDLTAADFTVTLDGKPRAVRSARFFGTPGEDRGGGPPASPARASAVSNTAVAPGRVVVFVAHRDSLRAGSGGLVMQGAAKLVDRLSPRDVSGYVTVPTGSMTLGRDHGAVRRSLERALGTQPTLPRWRCYVELRDALAFERRDALAIKHVLERECRQQVSQCGQEIADQAREMLDMVRTQTSETLRALRQVLHGLAHIRAPKLILLLSGGLGVEQETLSLFNAVGVDAAAARAVIHAIQIDQVAFDAEDRGGGPTPFGAAERQDGLRQVAVSTGGMFYHGIGTAEGVFARVAAEIANFYELAIELHPQDVSGKQRTLRIAVNRPGVSVRSRRDFVLEPRTPQSDRTRALLSQPIEVADLPLDVAAYTTRGDEASSLKVLVSAHAGGEGLRASAVDWAFIVFRGDEQVAYARDRATGSGHIMTAAQLPPGSYRLRFATIADDGREGVVEVPLAAGLRQYGELHSSDLIVGSLAENGFVPRSSVAAGDTTRALVELYAAAPESFESAALGWELYRKGETSVLFAQRSELLRTSAPGRRLCEVTLPALERPGEYVLSAVVYSGGRPLGKVSRPVIVHETSGPQ